MLAVCWAVPDVAAAGKEGPVLVEAVAPKSPPVDPAAVVGAALVDVDVDDPACADCADWAWPAPPKSEGLASPALAGCVVGVLVPAPPKSGGPEVAVVAAGVTLELCPPSVNPENGVEEVAVVAGADAPVCEIPELAVPPRFEKRPPPDPAGAVELAWVDFNLSPSFAGLDCEGAVEPPS